jgi:hypothetical protein
VSLLIYRREGLDFVLTVQWLRRNDCIVVMAITPP